MPPPKRNIYKGRWEVVDQHPSSNYNFLSHYIKSKNNFRISKEKKNQYKEGTANTS